MSKKDNSPAISFFSFQDIITSITGIMFLVVMMLVLMILNQSSPADREAKAVKGDLRQLNLELQELKESFEQYRRKTARSQKRAAELAALKEKDLPELKKTLTLALQSADAEIKQLADEEKEQLLILQKEQENSKKNIAETERIAAENSKQQQTVRQLSETLERQEKQHQQYVRILQLAWQKSSSKQPVFLECSANSIRSGTLDGSSPVQEFRSVDECLNWCRTQPAGGVCFVLLIKPSAFSYAEKLSRQLQKAGYERGREVIPDESPLLGQQPPGVGK